MNTVTVFDPKVCTSCRRAKAPSAFAPGSNECKACTQSRSFA